MCKWTLNSWFTHFESIVLERQCQLGAHCRLANASFARQDENCVFYVLQHDQKQNNQQLTGSRREFGAIWAHSVDITAEFVQKCQIFERQMRNAGLAY